MSDWKQRVSIDPAVLVGKPVIRGTRIAVESVVEFLAQGWSFADLRGEYPGITDDDIRACLAYASQVLQSERIYPLPS